LAINSADDERNPPELGLLDRDIKRVTNGRALLIPGIDQTNGHGTTYRRPDRCKLQSTCDAWTHA
jgi:homoserine O-acetyltransferase